MSRILIADDERRVCGLLREFLQHERGMHVACAHTGSEATAMLNREHFDLALIGIPLEGSREFELAALAANQNTAVLLMAGRPALKLTLQQFAFPYLGKPFTLDALRHATERVLSDQAEQLAILKSSLKRLSLNQDALARAMDRLLDASRARRALEHWDVAVARMKDGLPDDDKRSCGK